MSDDTIIEDINNNEQKFVEIDGKKFIDDGTGKPKMGDDGNPIAYQEVNKDFETPEQKKARLDRMTEQFKKKHPELYPDDKPKSEKKAKKSEDLDYGQKAYLIAKGIEDPEEVELVKNAMEASGKSLEEVVNSPWFKSDLKEKRDAKIALDATPSRSKRSGQTMADSVEYWIAKGELPPNTPENRELRQKVVNERMKKEGSKSQFTSESVVR